MKNAKAILIQRAQKDPADKGTAWRDRLEQWLKLYEPSDFRHWKQKFGPIWYVKGLSIP